MVNLLNDGRESAEMAKHAEAPLSRAEQAVAQEAKRQYRAIKQSGLLDAMSAVATTRADLGIGGAQTPFWPLSKHELEAGLFVRAASVSTAESLGCAAGAMTAFGDPALNAVSVLTVLGEQSLERVNWSTTAGQSVRLDALAMGINRFEQSYRAMLRSLVQGPAGALALPTRIVRLSAVDFFSHAELTASLGSRMEREEDERRVEIRARIEEENEDALSRLLDALDPGLVAMRRGMMHAIEHQAPDWQRHVTVSSRELLGHVLRAKAPDEAVHKWSEAPEHYNDGRPTRKARLLYLCRGVGSGKFARFVASDVRSIVELLEFLNRGTHEVALDLTLRQARFLRVRVEGVLRFILELDS